MLCRSRLGNYESVWPHQQRLRQRIAASVEVANAPTDLHYAKVLELISVDAARVSELAGNPTLVASGVRDQLVRLNVQRKPKAALRLEIRQSLCRWCWRTAVVNNQLRRLGAHPGQFALHGWRGHRESLGPSMGGVCIGANHFVRKGVGKMPRTKLLEREAACVCATVTCKTYLFVCTRLILPACP